MEENQILPRICVLNKPPRVNEYGFDLHAEMGKGQFVGAVDIGSPAEISGLRPLDHILAVNGESIEGLSHKEVVQRIKSSSKGCSLLVLDEEGYIWAKENNLSAEYLLQQLNTIPRNIVEQQRPVCLFTVRDYCRLRAVLLAVACFGASFILRRFPESSHSTVPQPFPREPNQFIESGQISQISPPYRVGI
uniref:PDZ domain-containing protein n=1 Tax=Meloidogyne floridensis TaxID=298350 RepID=A0A915NJN2_9BILA